ncbi:MAG TPA: hypothetical protein VKX16_08675 [Chloroflexota bacterium]|nr:hypothetical protein [Chloroflexota bacterium]
MQQKLGTLNAYQVAGLAVLTSTVAAIAVLIALRRFIAPAPAEPGSRGKVSLSGRGRSGVPHHFSEELIVPGFTETGAQVLAEDESSGRSPEGV